MTTWQMRPSICQKDEGCVDVELYLIYVLLAVRELSKNYVFGVSWFLEKWTRAGGQRFPLKQKEIGFLGDHK